MDSGGVMPTLNAFDNGDVRTTILIIDGTRVNDVRVYDDPIIQTVISRWGTGGGNVPAIAFHMKQTPISGEVSPALGTTSQGMGITMPVAYDEYNDSVSDTHHTARAGTKQSTGVLDSTVVRRLTPVETERLQGFPDNWTDGQADSHRYKQMGNAVTVNVIEWIGARL